VNKAKRLHSQLLRKARRLVRRKLAMERQLKHADCAKARGRYERSLKSLMRREKAAKRHAKKTNAVMVRSHEKAAKATRRWHSFMLKDKKAKKRNLKALGKEARNKRNKIRHGVHKAEKKKLKAQHQKKKAKLWHIKFKKFTALHRTLKRTANRLARAQQAMEKRMKHAKTTTSMNRHKSALERLMKRERAAKHKAKAAKKVAKKATKHEVKATKKLHAFNEKSRKAASKARSAARSFKKIAAPINHRPKLLKRL